MFVRACVYVCLCVRVHMYVCVGVCVCVVCVRETSHILSKFTDEIESFVYIFQCPYTQQFFYY